MKAVNLLPWREQCQRRHQRRFTLGLVGGVLGVVAVTGGYALSLAAEVRELRATLATVEPSSGSVASEAAPPSEGVDPGWRVVREAYRRLTRETGDAIALSEWRVRLPVAGAGGRVVLVGRARDGRAVGELLRRWQPPPEGSMDWEESPLASGGARRFTLTIRRDRGGTDGEP
ncbi:MAG: hypothetical protein ACQERR_07595 [Pseudomonadota bacterium]